MIGALAMNHDPRRQQLEDILSNVRLATLLQPILDVPAGEIAGYEALSRGPSQAAIQSPLELSMLAKEHGLLGALDWARVWLAIAHFVHLDLPGSLFVNVCPESVLDAHFAASFLVSALSAAGLNADRLVLEIGAHGEMGRTSELSEAVRQLRTGGIQIAIDGVRSGPDSMAVWSALRPAYAKIDVHRVAGPGASSYTLEKSVGGPDCSVIVTGVETPAQLAAVGESGIRYAQGYFIGHPSPVPVRRVSAELKTGGAASRHRLIGIAA